MALVTAASIADALAQEYPEVFSTVFRSFLLSQIIPVKPGHGKNDSFDVRFRSAQAARNATDGQDVADYIADTFVPATGIWAEYDATVKVTGLAMAVAESSGGTSAEVKDQLGQAYVAAFEELAMTMRADAYAGVSTSPQSLIGLYGGTTIGALGSTGTYYNINRGGASPLPNWAGNVLRNGGVLRPITTKLIDDAFRAVFDARGTAPNVLITTSAICDSLKDSANARYTREVNVGGKEIVLQGGYRAITHNGVPIIRDPGCTANVMFGLDTSHIEFRQLAQASDPFVQATKKVLSASGTVDYPGNTVPFTVMVKPLSIAGDYVRHQVTWKGQLRVCEPAHHFVLADVQ